MVREHLKRKLRQEHKTDKIVKEHFKMQKENLKDELFK